MNFQYHGGHFRQPGGAPPQAPKGLSVNDVLQTAEAGYKLGEKLGDAYNMYKYGDELKETFTALANDEEVDPKKMLRAAALNKEAFKIAVETGDKVAEDNLIRQKRAALAPILKNGLAGSTQAEILKAIEHNPETMEKIMGYARHKAEARTKEDERLQKLHDGHVEDVSKVAYSITIKLRAATEGEERNKAFLDQMAMLRAEGGDFEIMADELLSMADVTGDGNLNLTNGILDLMAENIMIMWKGETTDPTQTQKDNAAKARAEELANTETQGNIDQTAVETDIKRIQLENLQGQGTASLAAQLIDGWESQADVEQSISFLEGKPGADKIIAFINEKVDKGSTLDISQGVKRRLQQGIADLFVTGDIATQTAGQALGEQVASDAADANNLLTGIDAGSERKFPWNITDEKLRDKTTLPEPEPVEDDSGWLSSIGSRIFGGDVEVQDETPTPEAPTAPSVVKKASLSSPQAEKFHQAQSQEAKNDGKAYEMRRFQVIKNPTTGEYEDIKLTAAEEKVIRDNPAAEFGIYLQAWERRAAELMKGGKSGTKRNDS